MKDLRKRVRGGVHDLRRKAKNVPIKHKETKETIQEHKRFMNGLGLFFLIPLFILAFLPGVFTMGVEKLSDNLRGVETERFHFETLIHPVVAFASSSAMPKEFPIVPSATPAATPKVEWTAPDWKGMVEFLMVQKGFSPQDVQTGLKIVQCESGFNPKATNKNTNGTQDSGLWQINDIHRARWEKEIGDWELRFDPIINTEFALDQIRTPQGHFGAWACSRKIK